MTLPVSSYEELLARVRNLTSETIQLRREITSSLCDQPPLRSTGLTIDSEYEICSKNSAKHPLRASENEKVNPINASDYNTARRQHLNQDFPLDKKGDKIDNEFKEVDEKLTSPNAPIEKIAFHRTGWPPETLGLWHSGPSSLNLAQSSNSNAQSQDLTSSVICYANEPQSLSSFSSSSKRTYSHQQLGAKVEMVYSLLSMLDTDNREDMSKTFLAMSSSPESCHAMRQSGCLPLLIQLIHSSELNREVKSRAAEALSNIVHAQPDEKRRRREVRVLKLLQQIRDYCDELKSSCSLIESRESEKHPINAIGTLMKFSFDAEHRHAICILGGLHAITELIQVDHEIHGSVNEDPLCITLRRYAGMSLTNLTFGDGRNKALLCSFNKFMMALVDQLKSPSEDLRQVTASVLRNLSWRADSESKQALRNVGAVTALTSSVMEGKKESTLKSILSALWNLSAHCSLNKIDICSVPGALAFLVKMLKYKSTSNTLAIVENAGGILRNVSSHIAVREDYRQILRENNCFEILLEQLKSPSLTVVSNACGTLWNLSARCSEDQRKLWEMGATTMLRSLVQSKHKMISMGSSAALKNLLAANPNESLSTHLDSTAKSLGLQNLPALFVRKKRALEQELNITLAETCENIEPGATSTQFNKLDDISEETNNENGPKRSDSRDSVKSTHSDSVYERVNQISNYGEEKILSNNVTLHNSLDEKSLPRRTEDQKLMKRYKASMIPTPTFKKINQDRLNEKTKDEVVSDCLNKTIVDYKEKPNLDSKGLKMKMTPSTIKSKSSINKGEIEDCDNFLNNYSSGLNQECFIGNKNINFSDEKVLNGDFRYVEQSVLCSELSNQLISPTSGEYLNSDDRIDGPLAYENNVENLENLKDPISCTSSSALTETKENFSVKINAAGMSINSKEHFSNVLEKTKKFDADELPRTSFNESLSSATSKVSTFKEFPKDCSAVPFNNKIEVNQSGLSCHLNENSVQETEIFFDKNGSEVCKMLSKVSLVESQNPSPPMESIGDHDQRLVKHTLKLPQSVTEEPTIIRSKQFMNENENPTSTLLLDCSKIPDLFTSTLRVENSDHQNETNVSLADVRSTTVFPNFKVGSPITDSRALQLEANKICREIKRNQDLEMGCSLTSEISLVSCSSFLDTADYSLFDCSSDAVIFDDSENSILNRGSSKIKNHFSKSSSQTAESISLPSLGSLRNEQLEAVDLENSVLSVASITSEIDENYTRDPESLNSSGKTYKIKEQSDFLEEFHADATLVSYDDDTLNADSFQNINEFFDEDNSLHSQENLPLDSESFQTVTSDQLRKKLTPKEKRKTFHERYRTYTIRNFKISDCMDDQEKKKVETFNENITPASFSQLNAENQGLSCDSNFHGVKCDEELRKENVPEEMKKIDLFSTAYTEGRKKETFTFSKSFEKERAFTPGLVFDSKSLNDLLSIGPAERKELVDNAKLVAFSLKTAVNDFEFEHISDSETDECHKSLDIDTTTYSKTLKDRIFNKPSVEKLQDLPSRKAVEPEDSEKKARILKPNEKPEEDNFDFSKVIRGRRKLLYSSPRKNSSKVNDSPLKAFKVSQTAADSKNSLSDPCKLPVLHREGTFTKDDGSFVRKDEPKNAKAIPVLNKNIESKYNAKSMNKNKISGFAVNSKRTGDNLVSKIGRPLSVYSLKNNNKRVELDSSQKRAHSAGTTNRTGGESATTVKTPSSATLVSPKMKYSSSNQNIKSGSNGASGGSVKLKTSFSQSLKSQSDASLNVVTSKDKVPTGKQKTPKKEATSKIASLWRKVEETKQKNKNFKDDRIWIGPEKNAKVPDEILVIEQEEILDIPTQKIVHSFTSQALADVSSANCISEKRNSKDMYNAGDVEDRRDRVQRRKIISAVVTPYNYNPPVTESVIPSNFKQVEVYQKGSLKVTTV